MLFKLTQLISSVIFLKTQLRLVQRMDEIFRNFQIRNHTFAFSLKASNLRQNPLRRSVNFFNNSNTIITPLGLTVSLPNGAKVEEVDDGVGNAVDGGHSHLPQSSGGHCDKCCCKKAETSLEELKQEVNDLKELVKKMRHSNGYQFDRRKLMPFENSVI